MNLVSFTSLIIHNKKTLRPLANVPLTFRVSDLFQIFLYSNVLLTVHPIITLVNNQHDAQLLYFIIRLLQSSTCSKQRRAHHQEVKFY